MIIKNLFTYKFSITGMNGGLKGRYKCKVTGAGWRERVEATLYYIPFFVPFNIAGGSEYKGSEIYLPFCLFSLN